MMTQYSWHEFLPFDIRRHCELTLLQRYLMHLYSLFRLVALVVNSLALIHFLPHRSRAAFGY